jgi:ankyrin repeat protein
MSSPPILHTPHTLHTHHTPQNLDYSPEDFFTGFQSEGRTLLHMAASSGHPHMFQYILSQINPPPDVVNVKDLRGFTPLINATISESSDIMKSLLALGADVNLRNNDGAAAVHFAAGDGSVERVRLLHEAGAQLDLTSQSGSPLHWAAGKARAETMLYLLQQVSLFAFSSSYINYFLPPTTEMSFYPLGLFISSIGGGF